jgi:hypothetical protein
MKYFNAIIFLTATFFLKAQSNLVPNPSFETYTACPTSSSQIYYATPWTGPTTNSVDYFNSCSTTRGVPKCGAYAFQYARTGDAYAGFWGVDGYGLNYREYTQAPLLNSLVSGKCYYIEFYTNLFNQLDYGINNIGAHISNTSFGVTSSNGNVLNLAPNALKFGNPVITDTINWIKVSGIYAANGGEQYIIIGNFFDDLHTDTVGLMGGNYGGAYYYIDDVTVISTDSMSLPPYAGNDTTIALGDSVFIGRQLYGLNCNWYSNNVLLSSNISGIYVKPTATTTYVVEQNLCGNIGYDTVTVSVSITGIKQYADKNGISIYPNPASNKIFIEQVSKENLLEITLSDVYGKEILKKNKQNEIDVSSLVNGVYFMQIKTNKNTSAQKIIVQH